MLSEDYNLRAYGFTISVPDFASFGLGLGRDSTKYIETKLHRANKMQYLFYAKEDCCILFKKAVSYFALYGSSTFYYVRYFDQNFNRTGIIMVGQMCSSIFGHCWPSNVITVWRANWLIRRNSDQIVSEVETNPILADTSNAIQIVPKSLFILVCKVIVHVNGPRHLWMHSQWLENPVTHGVWRQTEGRANNRRSHMTDRAWLNCSIRFYKSHRIRRRWHLGRDD